MTLPGREPPELTIVTGAAGWLGRALVTQLTDGTGPYHRPGAVRALVRDGDRAPELAGLPGVQIVAGDIRRSAGLRDLFRDLPSVVDLIHTAGVIHPRRTDEFIEVNARGTAHVMAAARAAGVRRVVHVSSNSPFGTNTHPTDLFRNDRSVLSILDADHTFLNEALARHYGIPGVVGAEWRRVDGLKKHSRGGILGQATTLAKQSGASRTSPILRGNWISEVLLGERLPRPPKDVPQLPDDETATQGLTVRQLVEKHSSDTRCAVCHVRIDPFGFALEGFDAIGRRRDKDLADRPIDTKSKLPSGAEIAGHTVKGHGSGELLVRGAGTMLVRLRVAKGFDQDGHLHDGHESIGYVVSGRLEMSVGDDTRILEAGSTWYHPKGVRHTCRALEDSEMLEFHAPLRPDVLALFAG